MREAQQGESAEAGVAPSAASQSYRSDIDGLRALAVLPVVFYHFAIPPFSGGFTGVDVFFVISGFLITSIIQREVMAGEFSFAKFYRRRVRRIVPALAAVIIASAIAGYALLLPSYYEKYGWSAVYSGLGAANFYFFSNMGYFDPAAEQLPMLHMWSLAIEEQFYLVWPILLLMLARLKRSLASSAIIFLSLIIVGSFVWSEYVVFNSREAAFFLPHLRAWELAIGALLAFLPVVRATWLGELAALAGLGLIAYGVFGLKPDDVFPGHNALFPCIGAALIIWPKASRTLVARVLSFKPLVGIGLISYSLYLWHWPILVFFRFWNNGVAPRGEEIAILLAAALAISILSWWLIERPFRAPQRLKRAGPSGALPWQVALAGLAVAVIACGSVAFAAGAPGRLPAGMQAMEAYLDYKRSPLPDSMCRIRRRGGDWQNPSQSCLRNLDGRPRALIMGDSHLRHYAGPLARRFPSVHFTIMTASQCRPVLEPEGRGACPELIRRAYTEVIPEGDFDFVFMSARWRNGEREQVGESVAYIRRFVPNVIVIGQTLEYDSSLPELLLSDVVPRRDSVRGGGLSRLTALREINVEVRAMAEGAGAQFFDPIEALCGGGPATSCVAQTPDGTPIQYDYGHFTDEGALYVLDRFAADGLFANPQAATTESPQTAAADEDER